MNWFFLSVIALLCWSGSDTFSKIGCRESYDKYSQNKMVMAVGLVMGIHALVEIIGGVKITWEIILTYLPVSLLYIGSMAMGYVGLRYIELSISSPICNASGALVAVIAIVTGTSGDMHLGQYVAIAMACLGVIGLGIVESREDDQLRAARQEASNYKYAKSWLALAMPIGYCMLDAAGTFADNFVIDKICGIMGTTDTDLGAASANVAYELTFFFVAVITYFYTVIIKQQKMERKLEIPKFLGALCETAGQLAYIYAIADPEHVAMAAPIIASYCALSVLWSRLFLKEKLSWKHYVCILCTFIGIVLMGIYDM